jgi:hypothetical protein
MVDAFGRVDTFVVSNVETTQEIAKKWKTFMEIPERIQIGVRTGNNMEYFWGYRSAVETIPCVLRSTNFHGNSCVFDSSNQFKAEQIGEFRM